MIGETFRVTAPHDMALDYHAWFFPNGWRGIGPIERRDRRGYRQGKRQGFYPAWFVLACNNPDCLALAVVPVRYVLAHADELDPDVGEWQLW